MTPKESTASCNAVRIMTHEEFAARHLLGETFHEEITPASGFQVPASRFRFPASRFQVPAPGQDLQLISRVPPCSLKHIDTSCSLQHIDRSTNCSGHVPLEQMTPTHYRATCLIDYGFDPFSSIVYRYMPSSTRSNKETQLLFSPDPASLEHSIRKEARSSSTDNNTCVSLDSAQPPSTQTLVSSTDIRSPLSTDNTHLPVDQHPSSDIDRHSIPDIDRYRAARDGCAFDTCTR
ncbi:hypothetical protein F2Q70_00002678 [Brassica cretica]|uniref:Uncharacterized protein n=1 Tax=Brassica cretica TaxID=69181 RepID=A0A8S9IW44_BRACR|nr:hypothetical protein F2Q70_00002678 [Brassica cretica]